MGADEFAAPSSGETPFMVCRINLPRAKYTAWSDESRDVIIWALNGETYRFKYFNGQEALVNAKLQELVKRDELKPSDIYQPQFLLNGTAI
jgi:hypothetical protein